MSSLNWCLVIMNTIVIRCDFCTRYGLYIVRYNVDIYCQYASPMCIFTVEYAYPVEMKMAKRCSQIYIYCQYPYPLEMKVAKHCSQTVDTNNTSSKSVNMRGFLFSK